MEGKEVPLGEFHFQNRRRHIRVPFSDSVQFQLKKTNRCGGTLALDISEGGIRIHFFEFFPPNTELTVQIPLPPYKVVDCPGRVVWIQKARFADYYFAGIEFFELETAVLARKEIRQFIESFMKGVVKRNG